MAFLTRIYIITCLLLNFLMCQKQENAVYSLNHQQNEVMAMPKHPRSNVLGDLNPIRSSQMGIPICPAENPNDVRYENYPNVKLNRMKIVKDEDDGEDLDMAAGDDDEERDECNNTEVDENTVDDPEFLARISCLMAALDHHIKAICCNSRKLESKLRSLKPTGITGKTNDDNEPEFKSKFSKKIKHFQYMNRHNQENSKLDFGEKLGPGSTNTAIHLEVEAKDVSPSGSSVQSQNRGNISPPGYGMQAQNRGDISSPGYGMNSHNKGDNSLTGYGTHSQYRGDATRFGSGNHLQNGVDMPPPGPRTYSQNRGDISPPGPATHSQNRGSEIRTLSGAEIESPKTSDLKVLYPSSENYNHKPYEEYENKLRRLMANRDAIEKNVIKMLAPKEGERM
ncbi:uncharacterized protein LOC110177604 [Drosophila serrata]|uniref:uncharacterized protein LOC110177604 n=1 Tax=Drosophila serrata TaxID=7274 RepID=UPI000A1CFC2A|nr:uncharacterized protein LOC110177604 [Drosophila serrata]